MSRGFWPYLVAGVALLLVLAWGWQQLRDARGDLAGALDQHHRYEHDAATVMAQRADGAGVSVGKRPDADLVARTQQALVEAGLPVGSFSGVQPRTEQPAGRDGVSVQAVQLTLQSLRPAEFGAWLAAWNRRQHPWRITELQFTHTQTAASASDLDRNRFDYSLALAAPYVQE